jgi:hypothetical protein
LLLSLHVKIAVKPQAPVSGGAGGSSFNQLLGIKGAAQETVSTRCSFFKKNYLLQDWILRTCFCGCIVFL